MHHSCYEEWVSIVKTETVHTAACFDLFPPFIACWEPITCAQGKIQALNTYLRRAMSKLYHWNGKKIIYHDIHPWSGWGKKTYLAHNPTFFVHTYVHARCSKNILLSMHTQEVERRQHWGRTGGYSKSCSCRPKFLIEKRSWKQRIIESMLERWQEIITMAPTKESQPLNSMIPTINLWRMLNIYPCAR